MESLKKEVKASKTLKQKKDAAKSRETNQKSKPTEVEIREKALEIYHTRIENGYYGTPESDWLEAEEYFMINRG